MAKSVAKKAVHRKPEKEFEEEIIQIDRVTRVVAGGRRFRFRVMVAIGNKRGQVGIGVGKAGEIVDAIQKGLAEAKKNLIAVPIVNDTIPHEIKLKYKSARILLMPAAEGTGIIAGGAIRKLVELAGIKNILSKRFGTTNKLNNAKATLAAFQALSLSGGNVTFTRQEFVAPTPAPVVADERKDRRSAPRRQSPKGKPSAKPAQKKDAPVAEASVSA